MPTPGIGRNEKTGRSRLAREIGPNNGDKRMIAQKICKNKPPVARGALILLRIDMIPEACGPTDTRFKVTLCVAGREGISDDFTIYVSNDDLWNPVRFNRAAAAHGIVLNRWDAQTGWLNMVVKAHTAAINDRRREGSP